MVNGSNQQATTLLTKRTRDRVHFLSTESIYVKAMCIVKRHALSTSRPKGKDFTPFVFVLLFQKMVLNLNSLSIVAKST
jgi:hypothetical protein